MPDADFSMGAPQGCCMNPDPCSIKSPTCRFNHNDRKAEQYRWQPSAEGIAGARVAYWLHGADRLVYSLEQIAENIANGEPFDTLVRDGGDPESGSWVPAPAGVEVAVA